MDARTVGDFEPTIWSVITLSAAMSCLVFTSAYTLSFMSYP
jgi:hypothetical protein